MLEQSTHYCSRTTVKDNLLFGDWLVQNGCLDQDQIQAALEKQRLEGGRLGHILVQQKFLKDAQMVQLLSEYLGLDCVSLEDLTVINKEIAQK